MDLAFYRCLRCARDLLPADVKRVRAGAGEICVCPLCGDHLRVESSRVVKPLGRELASAFLYPCRPYPLAFSLGVTLVAFAPGGGLLAAGVRVGWLLAVLRAASVGSEDVEVDVTDVGPSIASWIMPAVRVLLAALVAMLPAIVLQLLLGKHAALVVGAAGLAGLLYFPAALIVVSQSDSVLAALNPAPAIALVTRIPGGYFLACALLLVLAGISGVANVVASAVDIAVLGFVLRACVGFLPLVAAARLLGILVYEHREEL